MVVPFIDVVGGSSTFPACTSLEGRVARRKSSLLSNTSYNTSIDHTQLTSSTSDWVTVKSITGRGVFEFLAFEQQANASNLDIDFRITIDGTVVYDDDDIFTSSAHDDMACAIIGDFENDTTNNLLWLSFGFVPFKESFLIERYQFSANSTTVRAYHRWWEY